MKMETFSPHDLWLRALKKQNKLTIWGVPITVFDFACSESPGFVERDLNNDEQKVRDLTFNDGEVIIDCGANIGAFSILMAKKFPSTKIYAIECMPHTLENLKHNLTINGITNVTVVSTAISGEKGKLTLRQHPLNSGAASAYWGEAFYPEFEVDTITLDDLLTELGNPEVALLKMDVEGSEHKIFPAFKGWDKIKKMTAEIHAIESVGKEESDKIMAKTRALITEKMGDRAHIVG